jgi:hypothetical protein
LPEPGIARATGHCFPRGLTLQTQHSEGNSPRGSSSSGGDRNRMCNGGRVAPTFGIIDDELQRSVGDEIRLRGGSVTHRRVTWCLLGAARSPTERR